MENITKVVDEFDILEQEEANQRIYLNSFIGKIFKYKTIYKDEITVTINSEYYGNINFKYNNGKNTDISLRLEMLCERGIYNFDEMNILSVSISELISLYGILSNSTDETILNSDYLNYSEKCKSLLKHYECIGNAKYALFVLNNFDKNLIKN